MSLDYLRKCILASPSKSCASDPLPTRLLKEHLDQILPSMLHIISQSLQTGDFPSSFKEAIVTPLLKKPSLECIFKNYRPISNLPFISKVLEKVVATQFTDHLTEHHLLETFQSAYRQYHSTETALLRVQNDILCALDNQCTVLLLLIDLSAAFDTVDH